MTEAPPARARLSGTWLNLFHQDTRNDYTNPRPGAPGPEWAVVVRDLDELGMQHLVLLAVANEGRPISSEVLDEILATAEQTGQRVWLSTGWVSDQDDDLADPATRDGQIAIIRELAARYGSSPAFEGWYLPCEDSVAPRISERTIAGVNALSAAARQHTPGARTMISPYFVHDAVVDDAFVDALARLDVDVVAYQDGVGCAYAPTVRHQFPRLRWAHDQVPRIELWANIESFSWETGVANVRTDALVPAPFPRLHQQLRDAAPFADRIVTFIAQGMMQATVPGIGHPIASARLRRAYLEYLDGADRWAETAGWYAGALRNDATGLSVECSVRPVPGFHHEFRLTTGRPAGSENPLDPAWVRFGEDVTLTIDLGASRPLASVGVGFLHSPPLDIGAPAAMRVSSSLDGESFEPVADATPDEWRFDVLDTWRDVALAQSDVHARYVRVELRRSRERLLIDQLLVRLHPETE